MTLSRLLRCIVSIAVLGAVMAFVFVAHAISQQLPDGRALFNANCAACHGEDGRGRTPAEVGFDLPLPNFTDCSFATDEASGDWSSTIHRGGPQRAFPRMMPAFGDALKDDEIDAIITYIRSFCADKTWPLGDLNFPLALNTEKAFPEDEIYAQSALDTEGPPNINTVVTVEKRYGSRGQLELELPFSTVGGLGHGMQTGIGDIGVGWKQNLFASLDSGSIFSVLAEADLPTGNARAGLGTGSVVFSPNALFGQMLPDDFIFQGQLYSELPVNSNVPKSVGLNMALERTFAEDDGWGRAWTPMVELLAAQNLVNGAKTDWDVVPQFQVSLSQRQHILFNAGVRLPLTDPSTRNTLFMTYLIWDWYDAGFFEGWH